jgi:hypothetical protein
MMEGAGLWTIGHALGRFCGLPPEALTPAEFAVCGLLMLAISLLIMGVSRFLGRGSGAEARST